MYQDIREVIKTGDLFFIKDNSFMSFIVRFFTRSQISHVGMFLKIGERVFTVECSEVRGCFMELASTRLTGDFIFKTMTLPLTDDEIVNRATADIGKIKYSYIAAMLSPFVKTDKSKNFCSKWITNVLNIDFSYLTRDVLPSDLLYYDVV